MLTGIAAEAHLCVRNLGRFKTTKKVYLRQAVVYKRNTDPSDAEATVKTVIGTRRRTAVAG